MTVKNDDWDPDLRPILTAKSDREAQRCRDTVLLELDPYILKIVRQTSSDLGPDWMKDLYSAVVLSLCERLSKIPDLPPSRPIQNLQAYVVAVVSKQHASMWRAQNPPLRQLRDRLRYLLSAQIGRVRFEAWTIDDEIYVGYREWTRIRSAPLSPRYLDLCENPKVLYTLNLLHGDVEQMKEENLVKTVLDYVQCPLPFKDLLKIIARLKGILVGRAEMEQPLSMLGWDDDMFAQYAVSDRSTYTSSAIDPQVALMAKLAVQWFWDSIRKNPPYSLSLRRALLLQQQSPYILLLQEQDVAPVGKIAELLDEAELWLKSQLPHLMMDGEIQGRYPHHYSKVDHVASCRSRARKKLATQWREDFEVVM